MARLTEKVAVITGGSGGIGRAAARLFVDEGASVLLVDLDERALQDAVAAVGGEAISYAVADTSQPDQVQRFVETAVERYGGIDIFLANAGIPGHIRPITEYPIDVFDRVMAVNVRGVWLGLKYVIPAMTTRGGGSIVITSSTAGIRGGVGLSAYTVSKHAVIGLMRTAAMECAPFGIRVNTVNPAPVETGMMRSLEEMLAENIGSGSEAVNRIRSGIAARARRWIEASVGWRREPDGGSNHGQDGGKSATLQQIKGWMASAIPLGRYGEPEEVARMMLFLASDESTFCTGGVYMVDGGASGGSVNSL